MRRAGLSVAVLLGLVVPATVPAAAGSVAAQVMVVGKERVLRTPMSVTLRARSVTLTGVRRTRSLPTTITCAETAPAAAGTVAGTARPSSTATLRPARLISP